MCGKRKKNRWIDVGLLQEDRVCVLAQSVIRRRDRLLWWLWLVIQQAVVDGGLCYDADRLFFFLSPQPAINKVEGDKGVQCRGCWFLVNNVVSTYVYMHTHTGLYAPCLDLAPGLGGSGGMTTTLLSHWSCAGHHARGINLQYCWSGRRLSIWQRLIHHACFLGLHTIMHTSCEEWTLLYHDCAYR